MAKPIELQTAFSGMTQDVPRHTLPKTKVWNVVDYLPETAGAGLLKRGGWAYAMSAMGAATIITCAYADFSTGAKVVAVNDAGVVWSQAASALGTGTALSAATTTRIGTQPCVMFHDKLIFAGAGAQMHSFDGTTVTAITAGPNSALASSARADWHVVVYKDRVVQDSAAGSTFNNVIYFSAPADPFTWDQTNSWLWFPERITGMAALQSALLIFHPNSTTRIRGSIPPPGSDFVVDTPIFTLGCGDARSIAATKSFAIFANGNGIYRTNGGTIPEDLTEACGLKSYWMDLMSSYMSDEVPSNPGSTVWRITGKLYRDKYFCAITNTGGNTFVDAFWLDPNERTCGRISNLSTFAMATGGHGQEELYFINPSVFRVSKLSPIFSPVAGNKTDSNGTAITPTLETGFFLDPDSGKKTWKRVYFRYDLRDAASDNPTLTVSYAKSPTGAYTAISNTLPETTDQTYARLPLMFPSDGVALKIQQNNASAVTRLSTILADVHEREGSRIT